MGSSSYGFRRPSSPPLPPSERLISEIQPAIDGLVAICSSQHPSIQDVLGARESFLRLRHTFIDHDLPREAKDVFRHLSGFRVLLDAMRLVTNAYNATELPVADRKSLLVLLKDAQSVLGEALKDHPGNKRFFMNRIDGSGVVALEQILSCLARKLNLDTDETNIADIELFYGSLLAAALGQEMLSDCFTSLRKKVLDLSEEGGEQSVRVTTLRQVVVDVLGPAETVENAEFLYVFLRLWLDQSAILHNHAVQQLAVPIILIYLTSLSRRNLIALHSIGVLSLLLPIVVHPNETPEQERELYCELSRLLCSESIGTLADAATLFRTAHTSPVVSEFLLDAIKNSKNPPSIQFDLSRHGFSSVELPTLTKPFPPVNTAGYTFAAWIRIDEFDPNSHTTLFGTFDTSQSCFVLAYIEKDTHNFILQTSIKGTRPSVRFRSTVFIPSKWYHICVVHKRPRATTSSRASLFVDGEFVEQTKAEYPSVPPVRPPQRVSKVQAFLGTPQDLASKLGRGISTSRWSLASGILFDEALSDDLIAVFYHLGPRYHGNFQDCLGSFQTYQASAALNLRNESLHPGKEEHSDIVSVIREKASLLIPESSILLNISPMAVLDDDDGNNVDESKLIKSLSRQAARSLRQFTRIGGNSIAINGGVPAINDALIQSHGVALLTGDPVVTVPQSLDDASWRLGGCAAIYLSMIEAASTPHHTRLAVEALFESVQDNWRNSEAMERENGYGILAILLREKIGFPHTSTKPSVCLTTRDRDALAMELLLLIMRFVGFDFEEPKRSVINNPLAFRVLLVDLDIWRFGEPALLEIYYSQFVTFSTESHHHRFNAKRLSRMRMFSVSS